ncbi:MAG: ankyrin repeat domain-containing protein [Wolbachia endosymbiont of Tetragnatha montana]|nr:ankyrin repeat domain-containing protein [Wolbachia endosymbiont of Tetragnatha montana]
MILTIQQWKEILNAVKSSKNGVLDAIKEELKRQDQDTYQEWEQKGSDINHLFSVSINGQIGKLTLLNIAASNGHTEIVKCLVDEKTVDVNQKYGCWTPLHSAAWYGHKDVVTTLLEKGVDINNVADSYLWTPLHFAAWHGHKDVVTTLLGGGANVNAADKDVWTPLHFAALEGHIDAMNALLAAEADVKLQNREGKILCVWLLKGNAKVQRSF